MNEKMRDKQNTHPKNYSAILSENMNEYFLIFGTSSGYLTFLKFNLMSKTKEKLVNVLFAIIFL